MMTINELHYLIAAMGFGLFFTSGLCTIFNHGWHFPYKLYVAVLFYAGLTFIVNTPFVDSLCIGNAGIDLARDIVTLGLAPFTMLVVCKLALMSRRTTLALQLGAWAGLLGTLTSFHGLLPRLAGLACFALISMSVLVWCVMVCRSFFDGGDSGYLKCADKRWFGQFSIIVAVLTLSIYSLRLFVPFLHVEHLMLVLEAVTFFPLLIFFQYQHGDLLFRTGESEAEAHMV